MKLSTLLRIVLPLLLLVTSVATAAPVVFERALPTANVNDPGADRSNIKWAPTAPNSILGDDFILPYETIVDSITVWMVGENPLSVAPSNELLFIRLFAGENSGGTVDLATPLRIPRLR
jgi:hypothetical protein